MWYFISNPSYRECAQMGILLLYALVCSKIKIYTQVPVVTLVTELGS